MNARYDPKKQLKDCNIIGYVYNPAWKDKIDVKQKPPSKVGRIDAFIKVNAPKKADEVSDSSTISVTSTVYDESDKLSSAAQSIEQLSAP